VKCISNPNNVKPCTVYDFGAVFYSFFATILVYFLHKTDIINHKRVKKLLSVVKKLKLRLINPKFKVKKPVFFSSTTKNTKNTISTVTRTTY
jgi:hypothetical protein